jgi:biopolymer transport protein TolR
MGMTVGGGKGSMSEPNIVPLIDVLLVLIIIFMVITPTTPQGLRALVPQPAPDTPHAVQPPDTIVVQLSADGKVRINQNDVSWDGLGPRLQDIFKRRADKAAFVKGDDSVEFVQVARAIEVMRSSGIEDVGLITAKIEAGQ